METSSHPNIVQLVLTIGTLDSSDKVKSPLTTIKSKALLTTLNAFPNVRKGLSCEPSPVRSLPVGETYQSPSSQLRTLNSNSSLPIIVPSVLCATKRSICVLSGLSSNNS